MGDGPKQRESREIRAMVAAGDEIAMKVMDNPEEFMAAVRDALDAERMNGLTYVKPNLAGDRNPAVAHYAGYRQGFLDGATYGRLNP